MELHNEIIKAINYNRLNKLNELISVNRDIDLNTYIKFALISGRIDIAKLLLKII